MNLRQRIFLRRCEMKQTVFRNEHTQLVANRALAYDPKEAGTGYSLDVSYFEQTGDGAVHTSVEDLLRWDENFYSGKVGGEKFLAELQERGKIEQRENARLCERTGHRRSIAGFHTVAHGGSWGGYRAQLLRFPEQHFSVACLCNLGNAEPGKRAQQVADVFLANEMKGPKPAPEGDRQASKKKETISLPAERLSAYAGRFSSEELLATYSIGVQDGKLVLQGIQSGQGLIQAAQHMTLRPVGKDTFAADEEGLEFTFNRDGKNNVNGFSLDAGRTKGLEFQRR